MGRDFGSRFGLELKLKGDGDCLTPKQKLFSLLSKEQLDNNQWVSIMELLDSPTINLNEPDSNHQYTLFTFALNGPYGWVVDEMLSKPALDLRVSHNSAINISKKDEDNPDVKNFFKKISESGREGASSFIFIVAAKNELWKVLEDVIKKSNDINFNTVDDLGNNALYYLCSSKELSEHEELVHDISKKIEGRILPLEIFNSLTNIKDKPHVCDEIIKEVVTHTNANLKDSDGNNILINLIDCNFEDYIPLVLGEEKWSEFVDFKDNEGKSAIAHLVEKHNANGEDDEENDGAYHFLKAAYELLKRGAEITEQDMDLSQGRMKQLLDMGMSADCIINKKCQNSSDVPAISNDSLIVNNSDYDENDDVYEASSLIEARMNNLAQKWKISDSQKSKAFEKYHEFFNASSDQSDSGYESMDVCDDGLQNFAPENSNKRLADNELWDTPFKKVCKSVSADFSISHEDLCDFNEDFLPCAGDLFFGEVKAGEL